MKKNYLKHIGPVLLAVLLVSSCQKSTIEKPSAIKESTEEAARKSPNASQKNRCQLTYGVDANSYPNWFHYNDKGLADEWRIDFGDGIPDVYTMKYDKWNRLIHADEHIDGILFSTIDFVWTGNNITKEYWNQDGFLFDVVNTYDKKGQMITREASYGYRGEMEYSRNGNIDRYFVYYLDELISFDILTYNQPNKNPFLAIQGIPYSFPYVSNLWGKWHETSDIYTIYDNGTPIVILDTDPAQTVMQLTRRNYLSSVTFFDRVSQSFVTRNFEYENCEQNDHHRSTGAASSLPAPNLSAGKKSPKRSALLLSRPNDIRKQILELRKQRLNKY